MNRLACLLELLDWLRKADHHNVYIVDNGSSYPPLLDFYRTCDYRVITLAHPIHPRQVPRHPLVCSLIKDKYYVLTDPDIVPAEECPVDAVQHFYELLMEHKQLKRVGFGLKIDDLPEHFVHRRAVIRWERQFWETPLADHLYTAPIDTTFALHRPEITVHTFDDCARTGPPYVARHLPWYIDSERLSPEEVYYRRHMNLKLNNWNQTYQPSWVERVPAL